MRHRFQKRSSETRWWSGLALLVLVGWGAGWPARAEFHGVQTVFLIVLENHDWASIKGNPSAPFLNSFLLPRASHAEQYFTPPGLHPSEPNYLWLEAGTNFSIFDDHSPALNQQPTAQHLTTLLDQAGLSWKTYQQGITGTDCPTTNAYPYVVRHNPWMFFTNVTSDPDYCRTHVRPYAELADDLRRHTVARYNFLIPDLCHDMHELCNGATSRTKEGDDWLAAELPQILASAAYTNGGVILLTWDEGGTTPEGLTSDGPLGLLVLSPRAKGHGYANTVHYTHSSTLRTLQEIFGVGPWLGDAANATDLGDLFLPTPTLANPDWRGSFPHFVLRNLTPGATHYVQVSTNLIDWTTIRTNAATAASEEFTDPTPAGFAQRYYRVRAP